jgi:tRNA1(Val) A37 N6-methylase TrmN6
LTPDSCRLPPDLVHKTVDFRYSGRDLRLDLSHALFSSFDIDKGTRLLLRTIAQSDILRGAKSVLDLGCGVGVIGLALGAALPDAAVHFRDRDALAVSFTRHNALKNGQTPASCRAGLTLTGLSGARFDFIVSNVPAKAGPPVIDDLIRRIPAALSPDGHFALVVVNPIAAAVRASIQKSEAPLSIEEAGPGHTVFAGGRGKEIPQSADEFSVYKRCRSDFTLAGAAYELSGYWGLPEFDTPSYATVLAADLAERASAGSLFQSVLLSNPGPGHLALFACARFASSRIDLVSRDSLQGIATQRNLAAAGFSPEISVSDGLESADVKNASADLIIELPEPVPEYDWIAPVWERATRAAKTGASFVFVSRPTEAVRFDKRKTTGWTRRMERKRNGFQGIVYRREG